MEPHDLAGMQRAMNDVETLMNSIVDIAVKTRRRCLEEGFSDWAADQMAAETFRVTLAICLPDTAR